MQDPIAARIAIKRAIVEQVDQYTDSTVTVSKNDPGRNMVDRHVWGGDITGSIEYSTLAAAEMPHEDRFTIDFWCRAFEADNADLDAIEDQVAAMADAVNRAISLNPALEEIADEYYVFDVLLASVDGPYTWFNDNGGESYCTVTVAAHTRVVNT